MSTGAEVIALFKSSNAACCSVVHSNFAFTLVRCLSGSHQLEKLLMYLERYASICRKETSSSLVFGGMQSCTTLILSALGFNPPVVNRCPWKFSVVFLNLHFSRLRVRL